MGDHAREFVKLEFSDTVKEEILVEDDNNIVGIISQFEECRDALEENLDDPGEMLDCKVKIEESKHELKIPGILHQVDQKTRPAPTKKRKFVEEEIDIKTAFTDQEDMALHALDLISPYDINFASSHMARRSEKDIERRLDDNTFRKKYFLFQKIPSFLFGITFTSIKLLKFRALMLVSEKHISNLICVNKTCVHGPDILELTLEYDGKSKFGIDISILVEFINENCPERFKNNLKMTCESLESLLVDSKISFHRYATSIGHVYTKVKKKKEALSIKRAEAPMSFQNGRLILIEEHKQTLIKIVNAIGKTKWDFALKLMHDVFGKTKAPTYTSKIKLQNLLSKMYLEELDPDLKVGPWTEEEDKCLLFLHKLFYQVMAGDVSKMWKTIARHMAGRSVQNCRDRLLRNSTSKNDLTLDNLDLEDIQEDVPSLFYYNDSHVFGLSVIPKNESNEHDIPTKLQLENRFLVAGTLEEIFILPCKETALRCSHQGITTMNFTYNPAKPATQFETYLKLTFTNQMKRVGLLDEEMAADFNFTQIKYNGRGIHEIISKLESDRFILPRDIFLELNTKEDEQITGGKRGFVNEKIYQDE